MATTPATRELYPFSTRDGQSIPHDILGPRGLIVKEFLGTGVVDFTLPAEYVIGSVYSDKGCILQFGQTIANPPVDGTDYANALFIPPGTILTVELTPGLCRLLTYNGQPGNLFIQRAQKWAALAQQQQIVRK